MSVGVPYMLAGQVLGVALTLTARQFAAVAGAPAPLVVGLAVQWTTLPLLGIALFHLGGDPTLAGGALIVAVAPAEITSALVAVLAAGSGAIAASLMAASLAAGTLLTPLWLSVAIGTAVHVDRGGLIVELALAVALPLVAGVALRTSIPALARRGGRALDLSAVCVVLVVFVSVGSARGLVLSLTVLPCVAICLVLLVAGYALGAAAGWTMRGRGHAVARAVMFPVAMREFGIAATVALTVSPGTVGVAGVYGALLMTSSPALARWLRSRRA
jgi:BASS family bile acid:Na+ symporter